MYKTPDEDHKKQLEKDQQEPEDLLITLDSLLKDLKARKIYAKSFSKELLGISEHELSRIRNKKKTNISQEDLENYIRKISDAFGNEQHQLEGIPFLYYYINEHLQPSTALLTIDPVRKRALLEIYEFNQDG